MSQRIEAAMAEADQYFVRYLLNQWSSGEELQGLSQQLQGCRIRKQGGLLYSSAD
jgi:hypothetical protein